ncbi:hypothetical protein GCM10023331_25170 [Algivirga pacifica]|uniref:CidA/LrgA family protein n=1 Tax=Algivirga pacifica TaxID=1162670 RepID=A0ABP9DDT4_9BACT
MIEGYLPGSVLGMALIFVSLQYKLIPLHWVRETATQLTTYMALFFIPAGVGILQHLDLLQQAWLPIVLASSVSTVLVILVVGKTYEYLENRKRI